MTNELVSSQPLAVVQVVKTTEWSSGICDCCDDKAECCFAFWCFPCYTCRISKAHGESFCLPLLEVFGCLIHPINLSMRVSMRRHYGIEGTMCSDCVYSTFCTPCVWCQMGREIEYRRLPIVLEEVVLGDIRG